MNNNRNQNNNRRRGRGNRNQGSGGGNQGNRIDSRARGNAPQLLDKYKKLAEDAHRNGDRVQAEYYLQFADHYFRVIADNRARQDEQRGGERMDARGGRRDERDQDDFEMGEDDGDGEDNRRFESREKREPREPRRERPRRDDNRNGSGNRDYRRDEGDGVAVEASEGPAYEPDENPFTGDSRADREEREEREPRPKRRAARPRRDEESDGGFDAAVLPPSISANDSGPAGDGDGVAEKPPRPRRKRGEGGTLSAVG